MTPAQIKALIDAWAEMYIHQTVAFAAPQAPTATRLNELFNLLIMQGDNVTDAVGNIRDWLTAYSAEIDTRIAADIAADFAEWSATKESEVTAATIAANNAAVAAANASAVANSAADVAADAATSAVAATVAANNAAAAFTGFGLAAASVTVSGLTLTAANWTGASAPYAQAIAVPGMTATKNCVVSVASDINADQYALALNAQLVPYTQGAGTMTIRAFGDKPTNNIPISVLLLG